MITFFLFLIIFVSTFFIGFNFILSDYKLVEFNFSFIRFLGIQDGKAQFLFRKKQVGFRFSSPDQSVQDFTSGGNIS